MSKTLKTFLRFSLIFLFFLSTGVQADVLDDILKRGTLRVGVSLFVPWTMKDKAGKLSGFEIDMAEKIAEDMGVKPEFKVYQWESIIAALEKGDIDLIAAGMAITPTRALKVNFTQPYLESGVTLATNTEMTQDIGKLEELNRQDIVIATVTDTLAFDVAQRLFNKADVRAFKINERAEREVLDGKAHAYLASMPEAKFFVLEHPGKADLPLDKPLITSKAGIAVKKGEQELLNFLNAWITSREADKWLAATYKYWFESLEWRKPVAQ